MAKYKNEEPKCPYMICPLGKGLPLCSYRLQKEGRLAEVRLADFSLCNRKKCPMEEDLKKKENEKHE